MKRSAGQKVQGSRGGTEAEVIRAESGHEGSRDRGQDRKGQADARDPDGKRSLLEII